MCGWLETGAPAGITEHPKPCGIFPPIDDEAKAHHSSVATDFSAFTNYAGVDDDPLAMAEIKTHIAKGHVASFDTLAELDSS